MRIVLADTDEEAQRKVRDREGALDLRQALAQLGRPFNYYDFTSHELDAPFPELGDRGMNGYRSAAERIKRVAHEEKLTLRQTAWRFAHMHSAFVGSLRTVSFSGHASLTVARAKRRIASRRAP